LLWVTRIAYSIQERVLQDPGTFSQGQRHFENQTLIVGEQPAMMPIPGMAERNVVFAKVVVLRRTGSAVRYTVGASVSDPRAEAFSLAFRRRSRRRAAGQPGVIGTAKENEPGNQGAG
jgi:hypothetical protein